MDYMIELHHVPHELHMYIEEIKLYGTINRHNDKLPNYIWISSPWDKDIIETIMGVKKVWTKRYDATPIHPAFGRNWTELMGTRWEENPE